MHLYTKKSEHKKRKKNHHQQQQQHRIYLCAWPKGIFNLLYLLFFSPLVPDRFARGTFYPADFAMLLGSALWRDCLFFPVLAGDFIRLHYKLSVLPFDTPSYGLNDFWLWCKLEENRISILPCCTGSCGGSIFLVTFECFQSNNTS